MNLHMNYQLQIVVSCPIKVPSGVLETSKMCYFWKCTENMDIGRPRRATPCYATRPRDTTIHYQSGSAIHYQLGFPVPYWEILRMD